LRTEVALLACLDNAVAAPQKARLAWIRTVVSGFELAGAGTTVARDCVAIVALLAGLDLPVPAHRTGRVRRRDLDAQLPWRDARIPRLNLTRGRTTVARDCVAVVTRLASLDLAVSTCQRDREDAE
jgi:hypothetical protein